MSYQAAEFTEQHMKFVHVDNIIGFFFFFGIRQMAHPELLFIQYFILTSFCLHEAAFGRFSLSKLKPL